GRWQPTGPASDAILALLAHITVGAKAPELLQGDFAFAAWNDSTQKLFCARDHFGLKPFYYYHAPGRFFIFATQIRALFCHPEVPRRVNKERLAQSWIGELADHVQTFYQDILRLPAAHTLTVSKDRFELRRYWALDPEK